MAKIVRFPLPSGYWERIGEDAGCQPVPKVRRRKVWRASRCKPLVALGWLVVWLAAGLCMAPVLLLFVRG